MPSPGHGGGEACRIESPRFASREWPPPPPSPPRPASPAQVSCLDLTRMFWRAAPEPLCQCSYIVISERMSSVYYCMSVLCPSHRLFPHSLWSVNICLVSALVVWSLPNTIELNFNCCGCCFPPVHAREQLRPNLDFCWNLCEGFAVWPPLPADDFLCTHLMED